MFDSRATTLYIVKRTAPPMQVHGQKSGTIKKDYVVQPLFGISCELFLLNREALLVSADLARTKGYHSHTRELKMFSRPNCAYGLSQSYNMYSVHQRRVRSSHQQNKRELTYVHGGSLSIMIKKMKSTGTSSTYTCCTNYLYVFFSKAYPRS